MNISEMKERIGYVHTLRQESTGFFRQLLEEYREKRASIMRNHDLSEKGREKQFLKLQSVFEKKALELSKGLQEERHKVAQEIKEAAETILISDIPPVDPKKQTFFNQKAEQLEAKIKFAVTPDRAKEALEKLVALGDEAGLANQIKGKILALSDHIIDLVPPADRPAARKQIGDLYNTASKEALPEGSREAADILETAESFLNSSGISRAVDVGMREISLDASTYLHNPNDRLALIGAAETSSQWQEGNGMQELQELAEKARRTGKMEDKIAYTRAKRALDVQT
ncbi:hypothetical protein JFV29_12425 [Peribacillus sp. TH16]|uniref:hypothetical protein n=1 Tax=Peribacillus sp. TH16 TaxID=2798482 RepID=UPI0019136AC5|nr:hypothetical protein [Peribacillus sp. TH16]MBK5482688.1 hypothetical protein [Peribacillus sp. TH16]